MDLTPEINAIVFGWKGNSYDFNSITFLSGKRFEDARRSDSWDTLAGTWKEKPGIRWSCRAGFTVTGIYHGGSALEASAVIMPLDQLQEIRVCKEGFGFISPAPRSFGRVGRCVSEARGEAIEAALPGLRASARTIGYEKPVCRPGTCRGVGHRRLRCL